MFEKLFEVPRAIKLHNQTPYVEERARFISHIVEQRYSRTYVIATAELIRLAVSELDLNPTLQTTSDQVNAAVEKWCKKRVRYGRALHGRGLRKVLRGAIKRWFRFLGRLQKPSQVSPRFQSFLDEYASWMEKERGFSFQTIRGHASHAKQFLSCYEKRKRPFADVKATDVDSYLKDKGIQNWNRRTVAHGADLLRAFFRYASSRGWCNSWIVEAIQSPRVYSCELLPSGPSWDSVRRLVDGMDTNRPSDLRNRAFTLLFAVHGFRVSEVANLKIEDIDWETDQITIHRAKRGRPQTFPLIPTVGNAIIKYLRVRPQSSHRNIFLTFAAPFRPLAPAGFASVIHHGLKQLGISLPRMGPHSLRHACATHLVAEGFNLKEIGDHLGHSHPSSTRTYAKVDLGALRQVALYDVGGVL